MASNIAPLAMSAAVFNSNKTITSHISAKWELQETKCQRRLTSGEPPGPKCEKRNWKMEKGKFEIGNRKSRLSTTYYLPPTTCLFANRTSNPSGPLAIWHTPKRLSRAMRRKSSLL